MGSQYLMTAYFPSLLKRKKLVGLKRNSTYHSLLPRMESYILEQAMEERYTESEKEGNQNYISRCRRWVSTVLPGTEKEIFMQEHRQTGRFGKSPIRAREIFFSIRAKNISGIYCLLIEVYCSLPLVRMEAFTR